MYAYIHNVYVNTYKVLLSFPTYTCIGRDVDSDCSKFTFILLYYAINIYMHCVYKSVVAVILMDFPMQS